jgi:hypothetical protein
VGGVDDKQDRIGPTLSVDESLNCEACLGHSLAVGRSIRLKSLVIALGRFLASEVQPLAVSLFAPMPSTSVFLVTWNFVVVCQFSEQ